MGVSKSGVCVRKSIRVKKSEREARINENKSCIDSKMKTE